MTKGVTFTQGVAMYMGAVLGSGILVLPGYAAELAGPASILSWTLLSLLSIPVAYTFARLALRYQNYGGIATIVEHAFGPLWSAIVGWFFFAWVSIGESVVGLIAAEYLVKLCGAGATWEYPVAFLFLIVACLTNIQGITVTGRTALVLSGLVLILLVLTIVCTLPHLSRANFTPFFVHGLHGIGSACVLIFWAFFGWEAITHLVPEFRNPQRDVMKCTWVSVVLIGIVYTALSLATVGTHTYGGDHSSAPLSLLINRALGMSAEIATVLVVCIVCIGTLNVYVASSSRLGYALAREQKLPSWFAHLNANGNPIRTTWYLFATNTVVLLISYVFHIGINTLMMPPTTLGIVVYIVASAACLKLLWHDSLGRVMSLISVITCTTIAPFATKFLIVPILTSILCILYQVRVRTRSVRAALESVPDSSLESVSLQPEDIPST